MSLETFIGRGLACCVNPTAAWRVLPATGRALVVAAYAGAGYGAAMMVLLIW
jgi:hypothetical protein